MALGIDTLLCPACSSYAHPFLDACAICGAERDSQFAAALVAPNVGYGRLLRSQGLADQVREVVLRYSLKRNDAPPEVQVRDGLGAVGDAVAYRVQAAGPRSASSERAHLELDEDALVLRERNPSVEIARLPLDAIVAVSHASSGGHRAGDWKGLAFDRRVDAAAPPALDGDLVVTHAANAGLGRVALANRRGFLAARARPDHYVIVSRWLGVLAAAAAEDRWTAVGVRRHAAQLGLGTMPGDGVGAAGLPAPGAADAADAVAAAGAPDARASVRDALEAVQELHGAGLITDDEFAAKRREILARI